MALLCAPQDETAAKARARRVVQDEMQQRSIIMVHLQTSFETTIRRRREHTENVLRLPMSKEEDECLRLHTALDLRGLELLREFRQEFEIPLLVINNDEDEEEAMGARIRQIVEFLESK